MIFILKPQPGEYAPYAQVYLDQVPDDVQILDFLDDNLKKTHSLISAIPVERQGTPFAQGEWTVKEIINHVIDQERVFVYRAMRFARHDFTELLTFDHDEYARQSKANQRSTQPLLDEYDSVRHATLSFFKNLNQDDLDCAGVVGGSPVSVRALAWFTAGHEIHHLNSITQHYVKPRP